LRGRIVKAAPVTAALVIKSRREISFFSVKSIFFTFYTQPWLLWNAEDIMTLPGKVCEEEKCRVEELLRREETEIIGGESKVEMREIADWPKLG
jgi:hypothetical protein